MAEQAEHVHPPPLLHSCAQCKRVFKSVRTLEQHQQRVHVPEDALRHMCEYCGYRTRIRSNLIVHKRRHTGEKPFGCKHCAAAFVSRYQLAAHMERHADAGQRRDRYKCVECGVGFLSARALYHHRPLHAAVKQYKCKLCSKSYAQAAGFAQHKRWHKQRNERTTAATETALLN